MSITHHFETYVPKEGTITLPLEFCDTEIIVVKKSLPPTLPNNDHWKMQKPLDDIIREQGIKPMTDPDRYFGSLAFLWNSKEEVEEFLRRRKES